MENMPQDGYHSYKLTIKKEKKIRESENKRQRMML